MSNQDLIRYLEESGLLKSSKLKTALQKNPREFFVGEKNLSIAYLDSALSIGFDQTISQPTVVVIMLELLDVHKDQKILEIGYGSGWQTAILSELVGDKGCVYAFEIIHEIANFGEKNLAKLDFNNIKIYHTDYKNKLNQIGKVDRIISGAAFEEIPKDLKQILNIGGRLVVPTHQHDIRLIIRKSTNQYSENIFPGFVFVPITHKR